MNYSYTAKTAEELSKIAKGVRKDNPDRVDDDVLDVEGVIEDMGITILPRPMSPTGKFGVEGYAATDPNYILMNSNIPLSSHRARFTLAEELAHRILEKNLWEAEGEVKGAAPEDVDAEQHEQLERDAKTLAAEILQPAARFKELFGELRQKFTEENPEASEEWLLKTTMSCVAGSFHVGYQTAILRARELELISEKERRQYFYPVL